VYDRLAARWKEFGLDGQPPKLLTFEEPDGAGANGTRSKEGLKEEPGVMYM